MNNDGCLILGHRGLEPSRPGFPAESSYAAFADQLKRGYGIEFDPAFLADGTIIVAHDSDLRRISGGQDSRKLADLKIGDLKTLGDSGISIPLFSDILKLIVESGVSLSALHLKARLQNPADLHELLTGISSVPGAQERLLLFDVTPESAKFIRSRAPQLRLAPSVAHDFDCERFNGCVGGTLMSLSELKGYRDRFDWVWLDEWDLTGPAGAAKKFYTEQCFSYCRELGLKIALVTPELHGASPGLLGGEAHADAHPLPRLMERIKEILALGPDAVCTDYPDKTRELAG